MHIQCRTTDTGENVILDIESLCDILLTLVQSWHMIYIHVFYIIQAPQILCMRACMCVYPYELKSKVSSFLLLCLFYIDRNFTLVDNFRK